MVNEDGAEFIELPDGRLCDPISGEIFLLDGGEPVGGEEPVERRRWQCDSLEAAAWAASVGHNAYLRAEESDYVFDAELTRLRGVMAEVEREKAEASRRDRATQAVMEYHLGKFASSRKAAGGEGPLRLPYARVSVTSPSKGRFEVVDSNVALAFAREHSPDAIKSVEEVRASVVRGVLEKAGVDLGAVEGFAFTPGVEKTSVTWSEA